MKNNKGFTAVKILFVLVIILVIFLGSVGYVKNIIKLVNCDFKSPYKAEAVYGAGTFIPVVGAVTGYITVEDK